MRQTITACLVVRNEEQVIRRCLESIAGVVDEIVVVHDGECKDATLEICQDYTTKIFVRPAAGVAEPHRPFAVEQAIGDWVLQIDADELLSEDLRRELRSLVECPDVDLYCCLWPYPDRKGSLTLTVKHPYRPCLARRNKLYFYGLPHHGLHTYGRRKKVPLILEHRPLYDQYTWDKFRTKWLFWIRLMAKLIWMDPAEIRCYGIKDGESLVRHLAKYRRRPLLRMPQVFLWFLAYHLYNGMWKIGLKGLKITLMSAADNARLYYYIFKYRPSTPQTVSKK